MTEMNECDTPDVGDISAALDRVEASYSLKIQEYRALIRMKASDTDKASGATPHAAIVRTPDVIYRPRRAA
ncbi:MAG: hypothetical protein GY758_12675 [Fuerstiella sp.]|nr:hypothetical protein [Fuerstiella sp.]